MFWYAVIIRTIISVAVAAILYFSSDFLAMHYFQSEGAASVIKVLTLFFLSINLLRNLSTIFEVKQNMLLRSLPGTIYLAFVFVLSYFFTSSITNFSWAWTITYIFLAMLYTI